VAIAVLACLSQSVSVAQTGGQGALEGNVIDPTGAGVPGAVLTAINQNSGVATAQKTTSAGVYEITPLIPGVYTLTVKAAGFETFTQKNIEVNGLSITGFNVRLTVGNASVTITVNDAPPELETTNATLGEVVTAKTYESLPVLMGGQQRDPTAYATTAPGAQGGTRVPIMSGTGDYLGEVYLDGVPLTTSNQQGDSRMISNALPVESVEQMQVQSSGPTAEYAGAGALSFTTKSGGNKYHGTIVDFVRNTAFDTWGFTAPYATKVAIVNGVSTTVPSGKPVEHQNELSVSAGGPIPLTHGRGFFFANYDKYHGRSGVSPSLLSVPTTLMRQGNFSELGSGQYIYNPLTNSCTGSTCTRQAFTGNIIPVGYQSPQSLNEEQYLPAPTLSGIANNYLASGLSGYDNHEIFAKGDYNLNSRQRVSFVYSHGVRASVGYGATLPTPYINNHNSVISPTTTILEHQYLITDSLVNQLKYAFTRFPQVVGMPTFGVKPYRGGPDIGITGLPAGQGSDMFPSSVFSTTTAFPSALTTWVNTNASVTTPNAFTLVDNLNWSKGRHVLTFGFQTQWLEDNAVSNTGGSGPYAQTFSGAGTANYAGTSINTNATGYSYADFLLGSIKSAAVSISYFQDIGGRYHPYAPYFQDNWRVTPSLTVSMGLRWDYMPPYHEVADRWSFFNPNATNALTNTPGELEYAGNLGSAISCNCRTPVQTYWKNLGPRLGVAWSVNNKTVIRAGFAISYSRGGGVGGRSGDATGTGQTGFGSGLVLPTAITTGVAAGPSFSINNGTAYSTANAANINFGGVGYVIPTPTGASVAGLTTNTGNYLNSSGAYVTAAAAPGYADPYLSSRAPQFEFFTFGVQRLLTKDLTLMVNYSGSESHFVAGSGVSGPWSGQLDPAYVAQLGSTLASDNATNILSAPATAANIAIAQKVVPNLAIPTFFAQAGTVSTVPTIGRALRPFPQYSNPPSAQWDNIANINYNALQVTLQQRPWKGLSYTFNFSKSKNIGDDGTTRSAFAVPAGASSSGLALSGNNRSDRDLTAIDIPYTIRAFGRYDLPFGQGTLGGQTRLLRTIIGKWSFASVFSYNRSTPLLITASGCTTPNSGTCMPDLVPGASIRQNGKWGQGATGSNLKAFSYLNSAAFKLPNAFPLPTGASSKAVAVTMVGTAPRTGLNLRGPSNIDLDAGLSRSFNITPERVRFVFRADCTNVANHVTFGGIGTVWSSSASSTFGQVTSANGNRDFQFSGRVTF
jgi:hypothetical protein